MFKNIRVTFLLILIASICYHETHTVSYRDRVIGCLFSDVCGPSEFCFDDHAFGRCEEPAAPAASSSLARLVQLSSDVNDQQQPQPSSSNVYQLDRKTVQLLEQEVDRLYEEGYDWKDAYTQCVLKTVLNDRPRIVYDSSRCDYLRELLPVAVQPPPYVDLLITDPKGEQEQAEAANDVSNSLLASSLPDGYFVEELPADSSEKSSALSNLLLPQSGPLSGNEGSSRQHQQQKSESSSSSRQTQTHSSPSLSPSSTPPLLFTPANDPPSQLPQTLSLSSSSSSDSSSTSTGDVSDVLKSYAEAVASGSGSKDNNSAKSTLSRDNIKSRLRSKHLKRTPSIRFVAQENDDDNNAEALQQAQQQQSSDPRLDLIVSMLMKGLKEGSNEPAAAYTESVEKSVNHRQLPSVPKSSSAKVPKTYFDYAVDSADNELAPSPLYIDNAFAEPRRNHDRPLLTADADSSDDDLARISPEELLMLAAATSRDSSRDGSPFKQPSIEKSSTGGFIYPPEQQQLLVDNGAEQEQDQDEILLVPLGRLLDTTDRLPKPAIRVLRDTNEEAEEEEEQREPENSDEITPKLISRISPSEPSSDDVYMVDVIEEDDVDPANGEVSEKKVENLLGKLLEKTIQQQQQNGDDSSEVVIENIDDLFGGDNNGNNNNGNDDDGNDDDNDEDKINVKEILLGDINYNNNYDTKMPNFYRKHRYDIKKPGPKYYEEYFFKPDAEETPSIGEAEQVEEVGGAPSNELHLVKEEQETEETDDASPESTKSMQPVAVAPMEVAKKDNIRSNKPVSEGPVKVEAKSENAVVIRSAEVGEETTLEAVDSTHTYVITNRMLGEGNSQKFVQTLEQLFKLPRGTFSNLRKENFQITFKVNPNYRELNASSVASQIEDYANVIKNITGYSIKETGIGDKIHFPVVSAKIIEQNENYWINATLAIFMVVGVVVLLALSVFIWRRNETFREKVKGLAKIPEDWANFDYQDLCRQKMKGKPGDDEKDCSKAGGGGCSGGGNGKSGSCCSSGSEKASNLKNVDTTLANQEKGPDVQPSPPSRSSTSSWVEEPVSSNMDITTGHIILNYMEDHLKKKDRLDQEWEALCAYEADPCSTNAADQKQNANKNRYPDILPFDHSRVILNDLANANSSDYINANTITDHDPRNPAYIVTQGPLANTKADFWQMIWESGSVIIVMLTRLRENGLNLCDRYWPEEGSETYQDYEVHLVSEHIWCDDYLVRSFYLKNLKTGETRTVTQFHFLSWPENGIPPNTKSILDFRRKVNKSYKGRSCPIVVHCSDGIGRTGTYILIDMVLNRLAKGAKEIDIAATLEHIRDQRCGMVKNKAQFEFVLLAVAEEVQAILKALPAN